MKLLIVSRFDRSARAINTITKYAKLGKSLGHHVSLFSEPIGDVPDVPTSREPKAFDYVMFVVYETPDFPDLPYLAHLLDEVPRERRINRRLHRPIQRNDPRRIRLQSSREDG